MKWFYHPELSKELESPTNRLGGKMFPSVDADELYKAGWYDSPADFPAPEAPVKAAPKPKAKRKPKVK